MCHAEFLSKLVADGEKYSFGIIDNVNGMWFDNLMSIDGVIA